MSHFVIVDGDALQFSTLFGVNTVSPSGSPQIRGSGEASILNKNICIIGDEKNVAIPATYYSTAFPVSGQGTLTIASLAADQQVVFATAKTPIIVVGSQFTATFTPTVPASSDKGQDQLTPSSGTGRFINSQSFVTAG